MSVASKRLKLVLAAAGVVLSVGVGAFGPLVRYEVAQTGARFGAHVNVERIRPTWHGVRLQGVDVTVVDVPTARAHIDEVEVSFRSEGRTIAVRGGQLEATGPREELLAQVEAWRAKHARPSAPAASGGGSRDEIDVGGFAVRWQDRAGTPDESLAATGVRIDRTGDHVEVSADTAVVQHGGARIATARGLVRVRRDSGAFRVEELSLAALDGTWTLGDATSSTDAQPAAASSTKPSSSAAAGAPPPPSASLGQIGAVTPAGTASPSSVAHGRARVAGPRPSGELDWERRVRQGGEALVNAAKAVDALLDPDAKVAIQRVHAELKRGADVLHVGPGRLVISRDAGRLAVELAPSDVEGAKAGTSGPEAKPTEPAPQALTFRLLVPVKDDAASREITADVRGGPIWLSTLGVKDGDFGLFDVHRAALTMNARVTLSADGDVLRVDGDGRIASLSISNKALSDEPVAGLDLAWRAKASARLDRRHVEVDEGEVDLGQIRVLTSGTYDNSGDDHRVRASLDVPLVGCQAALESLPKGLASHVEGMRMAGTFALKGKIAFDTARIDRDFSLSWDTAVSCRVTDAPPLIDVARFTKPFELTVYTPEGMPKKIDTGPGTSVWAPYGAISKFMSVAVLTTEDGGFYRHRGFDAEAIKNSLRENLKKRRFVRGASTISMQLAKNLYLDRAKNVSRKLQEAVLTMYLEQVLTKDQILELYLNIVELGPMVYGVGPASEFYFHADAGQLSLGQALYLSSILPNPKLDHFTPQGPVRPSWMAFLHKLMEIARKRERITDEELEDGLRETVVRGSPSPFRKPKPDEPPSGATPPEGDPDEQHWTAP